MRFFAGSRSTIGDPGEGNRYRSRLCACLFLLIPYTITKTGSLDRSADPGHFDCADDCVDIVVEIQQSIKAEFSSLFGDTGT